MKKILILEDNDICRQTLEAIMEFEEYEIRIFSLGSTDEAYKVAMENRIDIFVLDIILETASPDNVSGLLFAENIREVERYKFTPIIFITALKDPQLHAYRELHCYGYIYKPFHKDEVRYLISMALKYRGPDNGEKNVYFRKDGVFYAKKLKDIVYIKSRAGKMLIKTVDDELEVFYKSNNKILEEFDSANFAKCSRNVIVNKTFIDKIDAANRYIHLKDNFGTLEIGTIMKKSFLQNIFN